MTDRKNVLMLLPRWPFPPHQGDKIRAWSQVQYLGERHDVWLAALCESRPSAAQVARVRNHCREVALDQRPRFPRLCNGTRRLLFERSLTEGFFESALLQREIGRWSQSVRFDAALVFSSGMAVNLPEGVSPRTVLDMNDVDSRKWRTLARSRPWPLRAIYETESQRLARWEDACARRFDLTVLVNEREADALHNLSPGANTAVVRTGVSVPALDEIAVPRHPIVGFVGSMGYAPNVEAVEWFARKVWPRVHARRPDAQWFIIGRDPNRRVRALASLPGVVVTGAVSSVAPFLKRIRVFVVPMQSSIGVQTKLIEAMAHGKAAVVTPQVAGGFDALVDPPFCVAGDTRDFVRHVTTLLDSDAAVRNLSTRARQFVADEYDATAQLIELERLLFPDMATPSRGAVRSSPTEVLVPA